MSGFSVWIDTSTLSSHEVSTVVVGYLWEIDRGELLAKLIVNDIDFEENREGIEAFAAALSRKLEDGK